MAALRLSSLPISRVGKLLLARLRHWETVLCYFKEKPPPSNAQSRRSSRSPAPAHLPAPPPPAAWSALTVVISSASSSKSASRRFSRSRCSLALLGTTATPRCTFHLSTTWAGERPCRAAMASTAACSSQLRCPGSSSPGRPSGAYATGSTPRRRQKATRSG